MAKTNGLVSFSHFKAELEVAATPAEAKTLYDRYKRVSEAAGAFGAHWTEQAEVNRRALLAFHHLGEVLIERPRAKPGPKKDNAQDAQQFATLKELGIEHTLDSRARLVASWVTVEDVEGYFEKLENKGGSWRQATVAALIKMAKDRLRAADDEKNVQYGSRKPTIYQVDAIDWLDSLDDASVDLLITDPPYRTEFGDVEFEEFVGRWVAAAVPKLRPTAQAYICIGAYPKELQVYLNQKYGEFNITNVLVWTYRNTLGPKPAASYIPNWQAILYLRGPDAPPINCEQTNEQWAVQDINAPDARNETKYHKWQKPDKLCERLIRHGSQSGAIVIDPFCGSGSFLLAASRLDRLASGCDLDNDALCAAVERGCVLEE